MCLFHIKTIHNMDGRCTNNILVHASTLGENNKINPILLARIFFNKFIYKVKIIRYNYLLKLFSPVLLVINVKLLIINITYNIC